MMEKFDVIILGGGLAGFSAACRLQARGYATAVLEIHNKPGGCAGYYERDGFAFDVGATTLVDFGPEGVGGAFLASIGLTNMELEDLPGYQAWLPDRTVTLHKCPTLWRQSRREAFGDTPETRRFWHLLDELGAVFWTGAAGGLKLPIQGVTDIVKAMRILHPRHWIKVRYLLDSLGNHFDRCGLQRNRALRGLLSMLCEDTLHARTIYDAPLINAALGTSIRGRISRPRGGFKGFWTTLSRHYSNLGGSLHLKTKALCVKGRFGNLTVSTNRGEFNAAAVINTIPAPTFFKMAPPEAQRRMKPFLQRDAHSYGSGIVLCLGVPQDEVGGHDHRHHQILEVYDAPLGDGNNMFISVSAPDDRASAPAGFRSVMISTHTETDRWRSFDQEQYETAKARMTSRLLSLARKVYPQLGTRARVLEIGTPGAYARFARRPDGAVGGARTTMRNANQFAMPSDLGSGVFVAGDYTWPGLGSVACLISGCIAAEGIEAKLSR